MNYKHPKVRVLQLHAEDLNKIREEEAQKVFAKQIYLSLIVLFDKFDFTKEELKAYLKEMLSQYESVGRDFCSMEDVARTVKEETGIDLTEL